MQFFDLNRSFHLDDILTPYYTLEDLNHQEWILAKVRVEHDCLNETEHLEGHAVLRSNQGIQIELDWMIQDTGHELLVLFKGIETPIAAQQGIIVKGAQLVDVDQKIISAHALSVWVDTVLLNLLPQLRRDIKARLNLWDYVEYDV